MGAKEVTLVCLEQRDEMPAWEHEVNACVDEDIDVNNGWGPKKIITDKDNHVKGIIFKQCTDVFDENGRFSPKYCEDETTEYKADTIIMAIGQSPNIDFITKKFLKDPEDEKSKGNELFRGKWIVANSENLTTGNAAIFAGGDIIKPGLMVEAIGHGRRAAQAIDQYLGGTGELFTDNGIKIPIPLIDSSTWKYERNSMEQIDIDERITSFMDEAKILTPDISKIESKRCMGCDIMQFDMLKCIGCGT